MRKWILITVFVAGLSMFSYPIISNILSTKNHQTVIAEYHQNVNELDKEQILLERKKADKHNEKLGSAQLNFVDPFSEEPTEERASGNKSYYDALNIGTTLGKIDIPKIDVELPIYHGTSENVLSQGVGHLENSSLPTGKLGTHSVFTAHRGLPSSKLFRNLDDLIVGDQFSIQVLDETYVYEIFEVETVLPHETEWLELDEEEEIVTLLTCEPYMINTHRLLVKGKRMSTDEEEIIELSQANKGTTLVKEQHYPTIIGIISFLALISLAVYIMKQRKAGKEQ